MVRSTARKKSKSAVAQSGLTLDSFLASPSSLSASLHSYLAARKIALRAAAHGPSPVAIDAVERFLRSESENEQARALGCVKDAIRKRVARCGEAQCACNGAARDGKCLALLQCARLALALVVSPCKKKLKRLACALLVLCEEFGESALQGPEWKEFFNEEVSSVVRWVEMEEEVTRRERMTLFDHVGSSLRYLVQCKVTRMMLFEQFPPERILRVAQRVIGTLCDETLEHVRSEAGSVSDQSEKVEQLDGIMHFFLGYLEVLNENIPKEKEECEAVRRSLSQLCDDVFFPLLCNEEFASSFVFKPFKNHAGVALIRMNTVMVKLEHGSAPLEMALRDSVGHWLSVPGELPGRQPAGFLHKFTSERMNAELHAILLHQCIGSFPAEILFSGDENRFLGEDFVRAFRTLSDCNIFDENVQTSCLEGLSGWCRHVQSGLDSESLRSLVWNYWRASAWKTCKSLVDYVLANWSHGKRKARYHLEPLLQNALGLLDYVRLDLAKKDPTLPELEPMVESLSHVHYELTRRLIKEVVENDAKRMQTNLKAALPIVADMIKRDGIASLISIDKRIVPGLINSFAENAHVGRIATTVFIEAAKDIEDSGMSRETWLSPLVSAMVGDTSDGVIDAISTKLLPALVRAIPDLDANSFLVAFGSSAGIKEKLIIWTSFKDAGFQLQYIEDLDSTVSPSENVLALPARDLRDALLANDASTTIKALDLITCLQSGKLFAPTLKQLELCKFFFQRMTKWPHSTLRHRVPRATIKLFEWIIEVAGNEKISAAEPDRIRASVAFTEWFIHQMVACCYPLAPLDRCGLGLELLLVVLELFATPAGLQAQRLVKIAGFPPFLSPLTGGSENTSVVAGDSICTLVNMLMNAYDKIHELAFGCLSNLPAPLAGLEGRASVQKWVRWMVILMSNSRARDADAGATMVRLLYRKYICDLGWAIDLPKSDSCGWVSFRDFDTPASELDPATCVSRSIRVLVDIAIMNLACDESEKCERALGAYSVGSVIVKSFDGYEVVQAVGFSRELPGNTHAEETALTKIGRKVRDNDMNVNESQLDDISEGGAVESTVYTTMEPCSVRLSGNRSCTSRCIAAKVSRVVVGVREPSKFVTCTGTLDLRSKGVVVDYLEDRKLQRRCMEPNMFLFPGEESVPYIPPTDQEILEITQRSRGENIPRDTAKLHFMWQLLGLLKQKVVLLEVRANPDEKNPESTDLNVEEESEDDESDPNPFGSSKDALFASKDGSIYGVLRAIRYCWEDTKTFSKDWRSLVEELLKIVFQALEMARSVIGVSGENKSGALFAAGPIQGLFGTPDGKSDTKESNPSNVAVSRVVMSTWMLIRDGCELLQAIVQFSPLQNEEDEASDWILSFENVKHIGEWLLFTLGSLKHAGAIGFAVLALQGVCSRLLGLRRFNDSSAGEPVEPRGSKRHLLELPKEWVRLLLDRLEEGSQGFVLRRSGGFAGAFLAIARAEPRSFKSELLSMMLVKLIHHATSADSSTGTRVHSLNIIKMVVDATLQGDIAGEILNDIFVLAMDGFASPHWQVRNSSMMIFAQLVRRVMTRNHQGDEDSVGVRVSASFFFQRFTKVRQVILTGLSETAPIPSKVEPRLYPWLLLLSRLEPHYLLGSAKAFLSVDQSQEEADNWAAANADVQDFVPLLIQCGVHHEGLTRTMAARALGSIIPNNCILAILRDSLTALRDDEKDGRHIPSNTLHGTLLCAHHLIKSIKNRKVFLDIKEEIGEEATVVGGEVANIVLGLDKVVFGGVSSAYRLSKRTAAGLGCTPISDSVWAVVQAWMALRRLHLPQVPLDSDLLDLVRSAATDNVPDYVKEKPMALACIFNPDLTFSVLTSTDSVARLAAISSLQLQYRDLLTGPVLVSTLYALVMVTLEGDSERYPPEIVSRLGLLGSTLVQLGADLEFKTIDWSAVEGLRLEELYWAVLDVYDSAESEAMKCPAMQVLGALKRLGKGNDDTLCKRIYLGSFPRKTAALREVACEVLSTSRVLSKPEKLSEICRFYAWYALLQFLQDEVDIIRFKAVELANQVVPLLAHRSNAQSEPEAFVQTFAFVDSFERKSEEWRRHIDEQLRDCLEVSLASINPLDMEDLGLSTNDLFLFEPDNVYAEPLLEAVLSQTFGGITGDQEVKEEMVSRLEEIRSQTIWFGGPTFQPDLYRSLFIMSLKCSPNSLRRLHSALGGTDVPMHPHIRELLTMGRLSYLWNIDNHDTQ